MTPALLAKATGATLADADKYFLHLDEAMNDFNIHSPKQRAAFIATIGVESAKLAKVEEDLYYKDHPDKPAARRLLDLYPRAFKTTAQAQPYVRNPAKLGQLLYPGGFWGRGLIQLTGVANYKACGDALGFNYVQTPALLIEPRHAAMSAGWYWDTHFCNEPADEGDMTLVTRRVNGPALMHLAERKAAYKVALALGV